MRWKVLTNYGGVFVKIFLPPLVLLFIVSIWLYWHVSDNGLKVLKQSQRHQLEQRKTLFESLVRNAMHDLLFMAKISDLKSVVEVPELSLNKQRLAHAFKALMEQKRCYDQIRYIDAAGQEVVRVNYRDGQGVIVDETQLMQKADRYYFKESMQKEAGDIYISPMDLNIEYGRVEIPFKPMVRLATPLFDYANERRGILIVNYLAQNLLDTLMQRDTSIVGRLLLLNNNGYWLQGEQADDEWGFMFSDRKDLRIQNRYPNAWTRIANSESGQFVDESGMFSYETIDANSLITNFLPYLNKESGRLESRPVFWKLTRFVNREQLDRSSVTVKTRYIVVTAIITLVWGALALMLARAKLFRMEAGLQLQEREKRISEIVNTAFDAIITINERGIIETFNPAACKLFGYQKDDVIGDKVNILMGSPEREYHDLHIQNYIESGLGKFVGRPGRVKGLTGDGKTIDIEICVGAKRIDDHWLFTAVCRRCGSDKDEKKYIAA